VTRRTPGIGRGRFGWAIAGLSALTLHACTPGPCTGTSAEDHFDCGSFYQYSRADYPAAIREYDEAIRLKPGYVDALNNRGLAHRHNHELDAAVRDYTEVIRQQPQAVFAYNNRANVYMAVGNVDSALADLDAVLRIDPTFADAYYDRGIIHRRIGQTGVAIADFTEAIRFYAEAANGPTDRVKSWFAQGRYAKPSRANPNVREIDQYLADAYYLRSRAYAERGQTAKSDDDLEKARSIDPTVDHRSQARA
jgi:tetratricopeptide (TPR) repeat protein